MYLEDIQSRRFIVDCIDGATGMLARLFATRNGTIFIAFFDVGIINDFYTDEYRPYLFEDLR